MPQIVNGDNMLGFEIIAKMLLVAVTMFVFTLWGNGTQIINNFVEITMINQASLIKSNPYYRAFVCLAISTIIVIGIAGFVETYLGIEEDNT